MYVVQRESVGYGTVRRTGSKVVWNRDLNPMHWLRAN